jgi:hypothetical protein
LPQPGQAASAPIPLSAVPGRACHHPHRKENGTKSLITPKIALIAIVILAVSAIGSCGSKMEETSTDTGV